MVDGSGLENRQGASPRGFESHPLRRLIFPCAKLGADYGERIEQRRFERRSTGGARYAPGYNPATAGSNSRAKAQLWIIPPPPPIHFRFWILDFGFVAKEKLRPPRPIIFRQGCRRRHRKDNARPRTFAKHRSKEEWASKPARVASSQKIKCQRTHSRRRCARTETHESASLIAGRSKPFRCEQKVARARLRFLRRAQSPRPRRAQSTSTGKCAAIFCSRATTPFPKATGQARRAPANRQID
ncbi:MAG: hypothetical protein QOI04_1859 [Verrucomicrobiota bacterium]